MRFPSLRLNGIIVLALSITAVASRADLFYPIMPDALHSAISKELNRSADSVKALYGIGLANITPGITYRVYSVTHDDLMAGRFLAAATPRSWETLLLNQDVAIGSIQFELSRPKLRGLRKSTLEANTQKAIEIARLLPQVEERDYEVRVIRYTVLLYALWLHARAEDILIPLSPTFGHYKEFQPYSEKEIAPILRREAKKMADEWRKLKSKIPNNTGEN